MSVIDYYCSQIGYEQTKGIQMGIYKITYSVGGAIHTFEVMATSEDNAVAILNREHPDGTLVMLSRTI